MISRNALKKPLIPILTQAAGAHRKPRWLPVAKSKIYRIPKRPEVSEEERLELLRLNNNYNTQMRAIKKFYYTEMAKEKMTTESASSEMSIKLEAEEWERCVQLNNEWNKQVAAERDERRKLEVQAIEEYALQRMVEKDRKMKLRIEKASEAVRREKELVQSFITPDTLDAAIDHALANPTDYNYAINLKGNFYHGRDTLAVPPKEDTTPSSTTTSQ